MSFKKTQDKETQDRINWIFTTGMNNCDVIPDWVWMAAIEKFELQYGLPIGSLNSANFKALSHKNLPVPTLDEIKFKVSNPI